MRTYEEIEPLAAQERFETFRVIDVRTEEEFEGPLGHLRGAELVPIADFEAWTARPPVDQPLLLVCRSGARSARACEMLAQAGFGQVFNLAGGMIAWNESQLPVDAHDPDARGDA